MMQHLCSWANFHFRTFHSQICDQRLLILIHLITNFGQDSLSKILDFGTFHNLICYQKCFIFKHFITKFAEDSSLKMLQFCLIPQITHFQSFHHQLILSKILHSGTFHNLICYQKYFILEHFITKFVTKDYSFWIIWLPTLAKIRYRKCLILEHFIT